MMKNIKPLQLTLSIMLCLSAGFIGSFFTMNSVDTWYGTLSKPFFNPPNWLFGPVWTVLYILMGIAAYIIYVSKKSQTRTRALQLFAIQLGLNTLWSIIFFGQQNISLALIEILLLLISIVGTLILFYKINKKSAYLLYPYIIWVSFATLLNASLLYLN